MDLPTTYFWKMAQEPILVYNGRMHQLGAVEETSEANFVFFKKNKFALHESEKLSNLELLYKLDNLQQIDRYKTYFLNSKFEKVFKEKIESVQEAKKLITNSAAVKIIVEKILPALEGKRFVDNALEKNEQIDGDDGDLSSELIKKEEQIFEEVKKKANIRREVISEKFKLNGDRNKDDSILGKYIFHNFNMLIISKNEFYILKQGNNTEDFVEINKKKFVLIKYDEYVSVDSVEKTYLTLLRMHFNISAIKEGYDIFKKVHKYQKSEVMLKKLAAGDEYEGKNCSFERIDENKYMFYIHFPKFINKFPRSGNYYLFPAGKIMLHAVYKPKQQDFEITRGTIAVEGVYKHPFTDPYENKSRLCMGGEFKYPPSATPGYDAIPQVLLKAKIILMSGYNAKHQNLGNVYLHTYFNRISYASARRQGIPIANVNIIDGSKK